MNKLLFGLGHNFCLMAEEGGAEGGAGGGGGDNPAPVDGGEGGEGAAGAAGEGGIAPEPKPFLGGEAAAGEGGEAEGGEGKKAEEGEPKVYEDKDFTDAIVKDEALLGSDKNIQLDSELVQAMVPAFKDAGVSPEQANKLANAMAKAQMEAVMEKAKKTAEFVKKQDEENCRTYTQSDWVMINKAIDSNFKKGGAMNMTIRNTALGSDPELLAFLYKVAKIEGTDSVAGAAAGAGGGGGDGNSFDGVSKLW